MLRHRILIPLRRSQDPLLQSSEKYLERVSHFAPVELLRLKEQGPAAEEKLFLQHRPKNGRVLCLDERGCQQSSIQFAEMIRNFRDDGVQELSWWIGGTDGLSQGAKACAHQSLRLSSLTLPHRLALVVLSEQLYRAYTILNNKTYHRA